VQVPCFKALTFEPLTLQVFLKDLFIDMDTFALAGSVLATDASMHADVALFPLATTQGLGLQSALEVAPSPLKVSAGQTIAAAGAAVTALAMQLVEPVLGWLNPG
jgi:hypothetical protein